MVAQETSRPENLSRDELLAILRWAVTGGMSRVADLGLDERSISITSTKFNHGQSNPTFLISIQTRGNQNSQHQIRFVLRAQPKGRLLPGAHRVDREFRVLSALASTSVPVPCVYGLCQDPGVIGRMFYTMEYIEGRIFKNADLREAKDEVERRSIYVEALRVLVEISKIDTSKVGLDKLSRSYPPWIDRQIETWYKQYRSSRLPGYDYSGMEALYERLLEIRRLDKLTNSGPEQSNGKRLNLIHGDFRIDNLVFHPNEPKCVGVLDWELVSLGDAVADFATFLCPFHMPTEAHRSEIVESMTMPHPIPMGIPDESSLIKTYISKRNISGESFHKLLNIYIAVALFRFAGILYGVQARAAQGNASSRLGGELGKLAYLYTNGAMTLLSKSQSNKMNHQATLQSQEALVSLQRQLREFMNDHILPAEERYFEHVNSDARWTAWPEIEEMKTKAKRLGLWNLFLPKELGGKLLSAEYAPLAEIMGRCIYAAEVFNCSAPDTGNMELLARYGTKAQKDKWLRPLLDGSIRSCFAMTEPEVASSDATNLSVSISRVGTNYVINGRKWFASGAMDPRCRLILLIGRNAFKAEGSGRTGKHRNHSIVLIPMETSGVRITRYLTVFGYDDAPHGHAEIQFQNVVVDARAALLHVEGGGFEAAQSRLGGGRLHHCMRAVGSAERALEIMISRATDRTAFGKRLIDNDSILRTIAESRCDIESARLLTLDAAHAVDSGDIRAARKAVAIAKIRVPRLAYEVIDRAVQVHGGMGVCQDTVLAYMLVHMRTLRIADGPDEVHEFNLAKAEVKSQESRSAKL